MPLLTAGGPGIGPGWTRLALAIRERVPVAELDGAWVFRVLRREGRDFGTVVLSRVDGDRRRIYTASFVHVVKGRARGQFTMEMAEVGSGPLTALEELLALVPKRVEDEEPPVAIPLALWFPPEEEAAPESA